MVKVKHHHPMSAAKKAAMKARIKAKIDAEMAAKRALRKAARNTPAAKLARHNKIVAAIKAKEAAKLHGLL